EGAGDGDGAPEEDVVVDGKLCGAAGPDDVGKIAVDAAGDGDGVVGVGRGGGGRTGGDVHPVRGRTPGAAERVCPDVGIGADGHDFNGGGSLKGRSAGHRNLLPVSG